MKRPILISLSPNVESDDIKLAFKLLFIRPNDAIDKLKKELKVYFGKEYDIYLTNSGRSALFLIVKSLLTSGKNEVITQAFTCVAVPNSIIWAGGRPIYADIDNNYNIDSSKVGQLITKNTKAIIIQNTFGNPVDYDTIKDIAKKNNILVIEDCAHSLGVNFGNKKVGTIGDVAFLSFGRDKTISSIFGGAIVVKKGALSTKINKLWSKSKQPNTAWDLQQLLHPIIFALALPLYNLHIGKIIILLSQKLKLISKAVFDSEKRGINPGFVPGKMSMKIASIALNQFNKLEKYKNARINNANYYFDKLKSTKVILPKKNNHTIWLRFPIESNYKNELISKFKDNKILIGDWYDQPIAPCTDYSKIMYIPGSCPNAEKISRRILNLPTYPLLSNSDLQRVTEIINNV